jgi:hypothetical protein
MNDYLKYWRVVRQYVKVKHSLTQSDLDILLFLYSEKYFTRKKFDEFDELLSWDKYRFHRLIQSGWIDKFRKYDPVAQTSAMYKISQKAKNMITTMYKKLNGEDLPASTYNPMFKKDVRYTDKVYRHVIKEMNAYVKKQQQRRALE